MQHRLVDCERQEGAALAAAAEGGAERLEAGIELRWMQWRDRRHAGRQRHLHQRFVVAAEQALDAAERRAERDAALAEHRVQRRRSVGILMAARGDRARSIRSAAGFATVTALACSIHSPATRACRPIRSPWTRSCTSQPSAGSVIGAAKTMSRSAAPDAASIATMREAPGTIVSPITT